LTNVGDPSNVPYMPSTTYKIPASRLTELEKRIAKINKRADKLEKPPVSLVIGDRERVTVERKSLPGLRMGTSFSYEAVNVEVIGETPVLNGWEFLTTVLHRPAGNEFVNLPGTSEADLSNFVFTDKDCDHCHMKRVRNATFIVRNVESGELKQVGSTCLGDFTGYHSPQAAAKAIENIYNLLRDLRTWTGSTAGRTTRTFFLEEWMAFVSYSVRVHGFVSRNKSYDTNEEATTDRAKRHILAAGNDEDVPVPTDEDFATAQRVIAYVRENLVTPSNDFEKQLAAAYASDMDDAVAENTMGLTAAGFAYMWRAEKEAAKAQTQESQEYYGDVDGKYNLILTVEKIGNAFLSRSEFWTTPYNFVDAQGRHFVWFSTAKSVDLEAGKTYSIRGTVKDHRVDNYSGNKQTLLTRCKVNGEAQSSPAGTADNTALNVVMQAMA
jgi:hypothetical protein